jgi:hypothetical protein
MTFPENKIWLIVSLKRKNAERYLIFDVFIDLVDVHLLLLYRLSIHCNSVCQNWCLLMIGRLPFRFFLGLKYALNICGGKKGW